MEMAGFLQSLYATVAQYAGILAGFSSGLVVPVGIGIVIVLCFRWVLSLSENRGFNPSGLIVLGIYLGILEGVLTYWVTPGPWGFSMGGFIPNFFMSIARYIGLATYQQSIISLQTWAGGLERPSVFTLAYIWWGILQVSVVAYRCIAMAIIFGPMIIAAIHEIIGPVLLPFLFLPGLSWLGSGWIKSFVGYCLTIPVAWSVIAIISGIIMPNFQTAMGGSVGFDIARFFVSIGLMAVAVLTLLITPIVAAHITSGASGAQALSSVRSLAGI